MNHGVCKKRFERKEGIDANARIISKLYIHVSLKILLSWAAMYVSEALLYLHEVSRKEIFNTQM